jgi:capsular polysaccharide biosynthesis protein
MGLHPWLVILPVILLMAGATFIAFSRPAVYTATTHLNVGFGAQSADSLPGAVTAAQALADSYSRAVDSTPVVQQTAHQTKSSAARVASNTNATPIPNSTVMKVSGTARSQRSAVTLANAAAVSLITYTRGLSNPTATTSGILDQFKSAQLNYENALQHEGQLANAASSNPTAANKAALNQARVETRVALLESESLGQSYQGQQLYVAPLSVLDKATSASSDRIPKLELLLFIALVAGLSIGAALATVAANRA